MNVFENPFGSFKLQRLPERKNLPLRAWDAADAYLLEHLKQQGLPKAGSKVLVVNDAFGALSVSLAASEAGGNAVNSWSDSFLAHQAAKINARANKVTPPPAVIPATQDPDRAFDLVLVKVPKTLALLEDQLIRLKPHLHAETVVLSAGMVKHLPKSALQLFERIVGPTTTSLAKQKARLIFTQVAHIGEKSAGPVSSPYPVCATEPDTGLYLCHHANVFSKDKLDIGTRFFLQQFSRLPDAKQVVDLGCGNGILGIVAQQKLPGAAITFTDESYMAVASAKMNYQSAFPEGEARFLSGDGLGSLSGKVDLVLCNPPFHQQHSTGDFIAWQMFRQSHAALEQGGALWIVGNRHLNYHGKLKKLFGHCELWASNKKFVVLAARKQKARRW